MAPLDPVQVLIGAVESVGGSEVTAQPGEG
jgi:hypothetical protein